MQSFMITNNVININMDGGVIWLSKFKDLTGMKFGRLTVVQRVEDHIMPSGEKRSRWLCECDCGNKVTVIGKSLTKKNGTESCGCLQIDNTRKFNKYDITGEYGKGYLINGEEFLFDLVYHDLIKNYYWHKNNRGYIVSNTRGKAIKLHRLMLNCYNSKITIDHINHNKLDNRRCNLRFVSRSQNGMNSKIHSNNTSGVSGVNWDKKLNKWIVRITVDYKRIYLGSFDSFEKAKERRLNAEEKYYGEYSYKNSINNGGN